MAQTYTSLLIHIIFSTSGRAPLLTDESVSTFMPIWRIFWNSTPSPSLFGGDGH